MSELFLEQVNSDGWVAVDPRLHMLPVDGIISPLSDYKTEPTLGNIALLADEMPVSVRLPEDEVLDPKRIAALEVECAAGNVEAFTQLLAHHRPDFRRLVWSKLGSMGPCVVDDVMGEFELSLFKGMDRFEAKGADSSFLRWGYYVLGWRIKDGLREKHRHNETPIDPVENMHAFDLSDEARYFTNELSPRLTEMISGLTDRQRRVLVGRVVHGLATKELAEEMGVKQNTIDVVQSQALAKLRRKLREVLKDPDFTL